MGATTVLCMCVYVNSQLPLPRNILVLCELKRQVSLRLEILTRKLPLLTTPVLSLYLFAPVENNSKNHSNSNSSKGSKQLQLIKKSDLEGGLSEDGRVKSSAAQDLLQRQVTRILHTFTYSYTLTGALFHVYSVLYIFPNPLAATRNKATAPTHCSTPRYSTPRFWPTPTQLKTSTLPLSNN